ncbi:prephenate dehydrogenase [Luteimonas sp. Y-2-2-4F]|nr:prephenate dehydrogenase [Luteimonas sp. Y-2-2-4F]MCD9030334.1 prephenate dehydrogenase [Luteimonas sp. Y-2-2-4F]
MSVPARPVIGIVGSGGAYGRWLAGFFRGRMGLEVLGHDPADPASAAQDALVERADVLLFSTPIRRTVEIVDAWREAAAGREAGRLWLDVTSIKEAPVAAMLRSRAEVAGLHPMTAPPKAPTLKGRVLVLCEARLSRWQGWLDALASALEAQCVRTDPARHDRLMALVQAQVHALHLAQAGAIRRQAADLGGLAGLMPFRSASFELDAAVIARMLSLNPAIYEDIQFGNPHVPAALAALRDELDALQALVADGGEAARARFRAEALEAPRAAFAGELAAGNHTYERVGYLLADLADPVALAVYLPEDRPGSLRALLAAFERHRLSIASIHSSRTPAGELHFRVGFTAEVDRGALDAAVAAIDGEGIGRVIERRG